MRSFQLSPILTAKGYRDSEAQAIEAIEQRAESPLAEEPLKPNEEVPCAIFSLQQVSYAPYSQGSKNQPTEAHTLRKQTFPWSNLTIVK
jgi:hypothetical protein